MDKAKRIAKKYVLPIAGVATLGYLHHITKNEIGNYKRRKMTKTHIQSMEGEGLSEKTKKYIKYGLLTAGAIGLGVLAYLYGAPLLSKYIPSMMTTVPAMSKITEVPLSDIMRETPNYHIKIPQVDEEEQDAFTTANMTSLFSGLNSPHSARPSNPPISTSTPIRIQDFLDIDVGQNPSTYTIGPNITIRRKKGKKMGSRAKKDNLVNDEEVD